MKRILFLLAIVAICILTISSASAFFGIGEDDLIDVVSVGIYDDYSGGSFGGAVDSAIAMREDEAQLNALNEEYGESNNIAEGSLPSSTSNSDYDIDLGIIFEISPKETLEDVEDVAFENIEVTYSDGSTQKVESYSYTDGSGDLTQGKNYSFPVPYTLDQNLWDETIKLKDFYGKGHVKADMVINSSTETNKVVGHIDDDVTLSG